MELVVQDAIEQLIITDWGIPQNSHQLSTGGNNLFSTNSHFSDEIVSNFCPTYFAVDESGLSIQSWVVAIDCANLTGYDYNRRG